MKLLSKFFESNKKIHIAFWLSTFVFYFLPFALFCQPGTWVEIYGGANYDRGRGIVQTFDKGYIVCGSTSSYGMGNTDVYLLKIDSAGKYQWQNTFGGINIENCFSVNQTKDSGFVICGYTNSFGNGGYDAYLVKTDMSGDLQWQKTFGGNDWDFAYWAEQTNDGGYILAGETFSYGNSSQAYLVKTNSFGDTLWTKTFGGINAEAVYEVHQTLDSEYILAGYTESTNTGDADFYLVKTGSDGNKKWEKTFGTTNDDKCNSVALCADGGFLFGGYTLVGTQKKNYFLKTNDSGNTVNSRVDIMGTGDREIFRIRENQEGDYYSVGWADAPGLGLGGKEMFFAKWNTGFWYLTGGSVGGQDDEEGYHISETSDSGYIMVGYTRSYGAGPDNIILCKTDKNMSYTSIINSYVAVNEISEKNENTLIYPNPFSENLFLKIDRKNFTDEKDFVFDISDLCGRSILRIEKNIVSFSLEPIQIQIPSEKFTPGFYLASIQSGNKKIYRKILFWR